MNRVFIDTEFLNLGPSQPLSLVSIGLVNDKGDEFYGINVDAPIGRMAVNHWFRDNVWPSLPLPPAEEVRTTGVATWDAEHPDIQHVYKPESLREEVYNFIVADGPVELWGSYSGFDYVVLSQLFGTFDDHPTGVPMFIHDIQQTFGAWIDELRPNRPRQTEGLHHALAEARHVKALYEWLYLPTLPEEISGPIDKFIEDPSTGATRQRPVR